MDDTKEQSAPSSHRIVAHFKNLILDGKLRPGDRLPKRKELVDQFGGSQSTIQLAMDDLEEQGFIEILSRKSGTVVSKHLPHLTRYKVLVAYPRTQRSSFLSTMREMAEEISATSHRDISFFHLVADLQQTETLATFVREVEHNRLAGLIFLLMPVSFRRSPVLEAHGLPRVAIAPVDQARGLPAIWIDYRDFFVRAIDLLKRRGCKHIALAAPDGWADTEQNLTSPFEQAMLDAGLRNDPRLQIFLPMNPHAAQHTVSLMMQHVWNNHCDGLIVADDHLLEPIGEGLLAAGAADLPLVCTANLPNLPQCPMGVSLLPFEVKKLLLSACDYIDAIKGNRKVPELTLLKPGEVIKLHRRGG